MSTSRRQRRFEGMVDLVLSGLMIHRGPHLPHVSGQVVENKVGLSIICLDEEAEMVRIVPGSHDPYDMEFTTSKPK